MPVLWPGIFLSCHLRPPMEIPCYRLPGTGSNTAYSYSSYNAISMFAYPFQTHNVLYMMPPYGSFSSSIANHLIAYELFPSFRNTISISPHQFGMYNVFHSFRYPPIEILPATGSRYLIFQALNWLKVPSILFSRGFRHLGIIAILSC